MAYPQRPTFGMQQPGADRRRQPFGSMAGLPQFQQPMGSMPGLPSPQAVGGTFDQLDSQVSALEDMSREILAKYGYAPGSSRLQHDGMAARYGQRNRRGEHADALMGGIPSGWAVPRLDAEVANRINQMVADTPHRRREAEQIRYSNDINNSMADAGPVSLDEFRQRGRETAGFARNPHQNTGTGSTVERIVGPGGKVTWRVMGAGASPPVNTREDNIAMRNLDISGFPQGSGVNAIPFDSQNAGQSVSNYDSIARGYGMMGPGPLARPDHMSVPQQTNPGGSYEMPPGAAHFSVPPERPKRGEGIYPWDAFMQIPGQIGGAVGDALPAEPPKRGEGTYPWDAFGQTLGQVGRAVAGRDPMEGTQPDAVESPYGQGFVGAVPSEPPGKFDWLNNTPPSGQPLNPDMPTAVNPPGSIGVEPPFRFRIPSDEFSGDIKKITEGDTEGFVRPGPTRKTWMGDYNTGSQNVPPPAGPPAPQAPAAPAGQSTAPTMPAITGNPNLKASEIRNSIRRLGFRPVMVNGKETDSATALQMYLSGRATANDVPPHIAQIGENMRAFNQNRGTDFFNGGVVDAITSKYDAGPGRWKTRGQAARQYPGIVNFIRTAPMHQRQALRAKMLTNPELFQQAFRPEAIR